MRRCLVVVKKELEEETREMTERVVCCSEVERKVPIEERVGEDYLCVMTVGGDGTVLKALEAKGLEGAGEECACGCGEKTCPLFFSFDFGSRGRLCNIKKHSFQRAMDELEGLCRGSVCVKDVKSRAISRNRMAINKKYYSLNDIYIFCGEKGYMSMFSVQVNETVVYDQLRCDGLIVSTSSGSSGYNCSAGGPVVSVRINCFLITAVCPADGRVSPMVVESGSVVTVRGRGLKGIIDGFVEVENDVFVIERGDSVVFADYGGGYDGDFISSVAPSRSEVEGKRGAREKKSFLRDEGEEAELS